MKISILAIILFILVSCGTTKVTQQVPVPMETVRTEYINTVLYDSIYIKDSVDRAVKGDTIIIYKQKDIYKYKLIADTVLITDTIPIPVEIKTEIVKEVNVLKKYQQFLIYMGIGALCYLLFIVIRFIKKLV